MLRLTTGRPHSLPTEATRMFSRRTKAAGSGGSHRPFRLTPQSSSASHFTAGAAGFLILSQ
jgi:hypothetical protein